jgi:predicted nucleotidyltransferase
MEFINNNTIRLDKVLNELDIFVMDFLKILEKHVKYVIISGYVSLIFGRARSTEDVDVFIEEMSKDQFTGLFEELDKKYWCLNTSNVDEIYDDYLADGSAIRFALKGDHIPNFEVKFAKKFLQKESFKDILTVQTEKGNIKISSLERQIAFKRYYLKSDKDFEDAAHIEELFKEHIDFNKISVYKKMIEDDIAKTS